MRIAGGEREVVRAKRRLAEHPGAVTGRAADGQIRKLDAKHHRVEESATVIRFVPQINVVAAGFEIKSEVYPGPRQAVSIKEEELSGTEHRCAVRKRELVRQGSIVTQAHPRQVNSIRTVVVEFDQVRRRPAVRQRR